jgi:hypothetical protein
MNLYLSSVLFYVAATTAGIAALLPSSIAGAATDPQMIERGAYLATAGDCMSLSYGPRWKSVCWRPLYAHAVW